jgi:hypothetical protein
VIAVPCAARYGVDHDLLVIGSGVGDRSVIRAPARWIEPLTGSGQQDFDGFPTRPFSTAGTPWCMAHRAQAKDGVAHEKRLPYGSANRLKPID